jgi:hypothetical protein
MLTARLERKAPASVRPNGRAAPDRVFQRADKARPKTEDRQARDSCQSALKNDTMRLDRGAAAKTLSDAAHSRAMVLDA